MARILIVDDEPDIYQLIRRYAEREGYETETASDGAEAVALCREKDYDVIVMDVMMPDMDGYSACREIRKLKDIPVLMLSARGAEYDKLFGFEVGVDDYMVKPFSPRELMARIAVILRRHPSFPASSERERRVVKLGALTVDPPGRNVWVEDEKIELTAKEYDLLLYLIENRGIVVTRAEILNAVWGYDYCGEDRTVDWQIKLLRGKLGSCRNCIVTIRGVGYKFEVQT